MTTPADYIPTTLVEAIRHYADLDVANAFFAKFRWPEGVTCPYCEGKEHSFITTRRAWACKACKKRFTVKVGSVMEDSPLGLDKWLIAMWLLTDCKNGISSHEVARHLGISQKSAWFLMHRIRLAMQQGTLEKLGGEVEADETFIGGKAKNNKHTGKRGRKDQGRGVVGKAVVMGLLKRNTKDASTGKSIPSRVRAKVVVGRKKGHVQPEVRANVLPGATLYTDALKSYNGLDEYTHQVIDHNVAYAEGVVHTNGMENFWSLLDRSINGSYVSVDPDHLFRYVDEQSFRFNERKDTAQERFVRVASSVAGKRLMWKQLVARAEGEKPRRGGPRKCYQQGEA